MGITAMLHSLATPVDNNRYYYERLTGEQRRIYKSMYSGIKTFSEKIPMPLRPINELFKIFKYILLDHPLLFYTSSFSCQNDLYKKRCIVMPEYIYRRSWVKEKTNAALDNLRVFDAALGKSAWDKELYVHDYCLENFTYGFAPEDWSHTILGPLLENTGVCEGISKFVKLALDYLGVKTTVVAGKAKFPQDYSVNDAHAWNIVDLEGKTYHLDVTFDMSLQGQVNRYDYFNLSDEDIKKDHAIIDGAPVCATMGKDYYSVNKLIARRPAEIEKLIANSLKNGKKIIVAKLVDAEYSQKVVDKVFKIAQYQYGAICKRKGTVAINYNEKQMVVEIYFT